MKTQSEVIDYWNLHEGTNIHILKARLNQWEKDRDKQEKRLLIKLDNIWADQDTKKVNLIADRMHSVIVKRWKELGGAKE